jgi:hypothetical protein
MVEKQKKLFTVAALIALNQVTSSKEIFGDWLFPSEK